MICYENIKSLSVETEEFCQRFNRLTNNMLFRHNQERVELDRLRRGYAKWHTRENMYSVFSEEIYPEMNRRNKEVRKKKSTRAKVALYEKHIFMRELASTKMKIEHQK